MGCKCRAPVEQYPENAEWGPLFWKLLHTLAEHAGKQRDPNLQQEEMRLWAGLLTTLQGAIPCDICRNHYGEWLAANDVGVLKTMSYATFAGWPRNYLWSLHNRVNEGNDKAVFTVEALGTAYKGINVNKCCKELEPVMRKAIQLSGVSLLSWRNFHGNVRKLQGLYA